MGRRRDDRWSPPEHPDSPRPDAYSLSEDARGGDVCHAVNPIPVWAWIQFPAFHVRVRGFVRSWTVDAVLVEWAQFGHPTSAWVWRSAVKHRALRTDDRRMPDARPHDRRAPRTDDRRTLRTDERGTRQSDTG